MFSSVKSVIYIFIGIILGIGIMHYIGSSNDHSSEPMPENSEKEPLYWVAPMDDNYRRDGPGKSPMGMDLIPVYAEEDAVDHGSGTVTISPSVENNLGVRTARVALESMTATIYTVGYVQYDEDKLVHIHPRVSGWIEKLYVKAIGDPIKQGQPLYTLYSPELVNAQDELLLTLKSGNQSLINASRQRMRQLQISEEFIANLERTRKVQQTVTFYSPQSGVVDELKIREGFYVEPGNTMFSIGQLDQVWVEAEIFERDTGLVKAGLPVSMRLDYLPGKMWNGSVDYVYPTLNSQTRTLRVRLTFDNPKLELKPNMFAQVSIHADKQEPVITVPREAVIRTGKQNRVVLALGDGQFKSVAVTLGRVDRDKIEILSGLNEDDVIVTSAQFLIDSESSKSSDFKRMSSEKLPELAWVEGTINQVIRESRLLNISHGPIEAWDMQGMTMFFNLAEDISIEDLSEGMNIRFSAQKIDSGFLILEVNRKVVEQESPTDHQHH